MIVVLGMLSMLKGPTKKISSKNVNFFIDEDGKKVYLNQMKSEY